MEKRMFRWHDWESFKDKLSKFFEKFFNEFSLEMPAIFYQETFTPAVDITEDEETFTVTAEVPGMSPKDIKLRIEGNILTIRGEKKLITDIRAKNIRRRESRVGTFTRQIPLPEYVDPHSARATCKDGILTITFKKIPEEKPKGFEIPFED
jgi:HSP20 family protein